MFKQLDLRIIGGILIIGILCWAGTYFISKRSYNRFASEIDAASDSTQSTERVLENATNTTDPLSKPKSQDKTFNKNTRTEQSNVADSENTTITKEKEGQTENSQKQPTSNFDTNALFSTIGIPEEVTSLLDEDVEEADFKKAEAHLTEKYGQSPEVEAIINKLKQLSGGPVEIDDLISIFDAWIQVLPEDQQDTRKQLRDVITQLNMVKTMGVSDSPVIIELDTSESAK